MKPAYLYWIRLPEHTDMFSQGYVGITTRTVNARWSAHKTSAKLFSKQHLPVYRAINKYGPESLVIETAVVGSEQYVLDLEIKLRPTEGIGWNCAMGGQDTGRGRTHSPEEIKRRSESSKGRRHSEETKKMMSLAAKGKPKSESHRANMSKSNIGRYRSPEATAKQRLKMLGKSPMTEQGRSALSLAKKNLKPWQRSRSDPAVWCNAIGMYEWYSIDGKLTSRFLANTYNLKDSKFSKITDMLRSGWNPSEDTAYLSWLADYKQKQVPQ